MASGVSTIEFESWLSPKQAVQLLDAAFGDDSGSFISKHTLLDRIRGGAVKTAARTSKFSIRPKPIEFLEIPATDWGDVGENSIFWVNGDLSYKTQIDYQTISVRRFDVRFEPEAVRAIIPPTVKPAADEQRVPTQDKVATERAPVSEAKLKAWYALYQSIYPDTSESHAWQSAQGFFHDKDVSRNQIRAVRGDRPMGRPKID